MANTDERLYATVGCHPTRCLEFEEGDPVNYMKGLSDLIRANSRKVVAFGEIGLDYDRLMFCPRDTQLKYDCKLLQSHLKKLIFPRYFEKQLVLAKDVQLPLFLHSRNSAADLAAMLTKHREGIRGGVVRSILFH